MAFQPIEQCYWVVPGKFLAGEYPRDKDKSSSISKINLLIGAGVSAFIDLTEKNEGLLPYSELIGTASHQRFPIPDVSIPEPSEVTVAAFLNGSRIPTEIFILSLVNLVCRWLRAQIVISGQFFIDRKDFISRQIFAS
jgi:hypothetical protein